MNSSVVPTSTPLFLALTAIAACIALAPSAAAQEPTVQFTGCLGDKGDLTEIAVGSEPLEACDKKSTQVTWNAVGPQGPKGERGSTGPAGSDGESCSVAEDGSGLVTLTCPDGSVASWQGDSPPQPEIIAYAGTEDGEVWLTVTDMDGDESVSAGDQLEIFSLPNENCVLDTRYAGIYALGERFEGLGGHIVSEFPPPDETALGYQHAYLFSLTNERYGTGFSFQLLLAQSFPYVDQAFGVGYGRGVEEGIGVPAPEDGGYWLEANFDDWASIPLPLPDFLGFTESTQPRKACGTDRLVVEFMVPLGD